MNGVTSEQEFGWMQVKSTKSIAHKCEAFMYDVFQEKVNIIFYQDLMSTDDK